MKKEGSVESAYLHQRTLGPVLGARRSGARSFHTPWAAMKEGIGRPTTLSAAVRPVRLPVQFRVPAGGGPRAVLSAGSCRRRPRTAPQPRSVPAVPAELREARRGWGGCAEVLPEHGTIPSPASPYANSVTRSRRQTSLGLSRPFPSHFTPRTHSPCDISTPASSQTPACSRSALRCASPLHPHVIHSPPPPPPQG